MAPFNHHSWSRLFRSLKQHSYSRRSSLTLLFLLALPYWTTFTFCSRFLLFPSRRRIFQGRYWNGQRDQLRRIRRCPPSKWYKQWWWKFHNPPDNGTPKHHHLWSFHDTDRQALFHANILLQLKWLWMLRNFYLMSLVSWIHADASQDVTFRLSSLPGRPSRNAT